MAPGDESPEINVAAFGSHDIVSLGQCESRVIYAPPGYLLYRQGGVLLARPFDAKALKFRGPPVAVGRLPRGTPWNDQFSASNDGTLAYLPPVEGVVTRLMCVDRAGKDVTQLGGTGEYLEARVSPRGDLVAYVQVDPTTGQQDLWIWDATTGGATKLTNERVLARGPTWSPNQEQIAYGSSIAFYRSVCVDLATRGKPDSLAGVSAISVPTDWSSDGRWIVLTLFQHDTRWDVDAYDRSTHRLLSVADSPNDEVGGRLSPDGRWIAYSSNEGGTGAVYLAPFPGPGRPRKVSPDGAYHPQWRSDGRELYFELDGALEAVQVSTSPEVSVSAPKPLFKRKLQGASEWSCACSPFPGGNRFLIVEVLAAGEPQKAVVVTHWTERAKSK
jgi:hypothetical protein